MNELEEDIDAKLMKGYQSTIKCGLKKAVMSLACHILLLYKAFTLGHAVVQDLNDVFLGVNFQVKLDKKLIKKAAKIYGLIINAVTSHVGHASKLTVGHCFCACTHLLSVFVLTKLFFSRRSYRV